MLKVRVLTGWNRTVSIWAVTALLFLAGCASVQLIAPYDATIDQRVTNLQTSADTFLQKIISKGGSSPSDYPSHVEFYNSTLVSIMTLQTRVNAISDNKETSNQIQILQKQFLSLQEKDQKDGLNTPVAQNTLNALNGTFQAILTLEIAKKSLNTSAAPTTK
jgi:hypothetical protein